MIASHGDHSVVLYIHLQTAEHMAEATEGFDFAVRYSPPPDEAFESMDKKRIKVLQKNLVKVVQSLVRENFCNIIDGTF